VFGRHLTGDRKGKLVTERSFGVSTHLFHEQRLTRDHLVHIAAHGFEALEVFATRSHFDYHSPEAVADLAEWLSDTSLTLHSIHAPAFEALRDGRWQGTLSNASTQDARRAAAVAEARAALDVATRIPFRFLVMHVGVPGDAPADDNDLGAALRSIEDVAALSARVGVHLALEVMPNRMSSAGELVRLVEERLDGLDVGICLDFGHAHLMGDVVEAVETLSGHLWTTHVHDNHGRRDDHLVPFDGTIDWSAAMMGTQKIGYDGTLMFEVGGASADPVHLLARMAGARARLEESLILPVSFPGE
jgi:sugar phosphate isomerase/epimerase